MEKRAIGIVLIGAVISAPAAGYPAELAALPAMVAEALENNPGLRAARMRWEASRARIPQAKSPDNPTIGIEFEKIPRGTLKFNRVAPDDRMLSFSQFVPLFGKLSLKGKIAVVESQMFASEYKNKELDLINQIKAAYYGLFLNYKEIELERENIQLLESIAKVAEASYAVGDVTQEAVYKLHSEIAKLSNDLLNLEAEKRAKETRLNTLLNRDPEGALGIVDLKEEIVFPPEIKSLYQLTLLNQPELVTFSYAIEKNKYATSLAKRSFFPDLMAGIVQRGITSGTIGPWDLMLSFTVPFWFWTKQRYEVKEAIANLAEAEAAYQAMQNKAFAEVKDLASRIEIAKNKVGLYKTSLIPILQSSTASSLAAFRSGRGDFMMLLDSQRMLTEAKMNYYRAVVEYHMNLAGLERVVGVDVRSKEPSP